MVMQEKSCAILMIAKEIEKERKKCERYWPDKVYVQLNKLLIYDSK